MAEYMGLFPSRNRRGDFISPESFQNISSELLNELIDLSIVSSKAQGSNDNLSGCRKDKRSHRKTLMGFQAPYMLKHLPSLMKTTKAISSK